MRKRNNGTRPGKAQTKWAIEPGVTASTLRRTGVGMMNGRHPSPDIYRIYEWTQRSGVELENTARLAACDGDRELRHRRQVHYELTPTLQCEGWKQKSVRSLCLVSQRPSYLILTKISMRGVSTCSFTKSGELRREVLSQQIRSANSKLIRNPHPWTTSVNNMIPVQQQATPSETVILIRSLFGHDNSLNAASCGSSCRGSCVLASPDSTPEFPKRVKLEGMAELY